MDVKCQLDLSVVTTSDQFSGSMLVETERGSRTFLFDCEHFSDAACAFRMREGETEVLQWTPEAELESFNDSQRGLLIVFSTLGLPMVSQLLEKRRSLEEGMQGRIFKTAEREMGATIELKMTSSAQADIEGIPAEYIQALFQ